VDGPVLVLTWLAAMAAGALLCVGIIEVATGRAVINLSRSRYSAGENRASGACSTIQGVSTAIWALIGGLSFGSHSLPVFWAGHWWGVLLPGSFGLVFMSTLFVQAYISLRHENRRRLIGSSQS
jgi:hypothetical protein